MRKYNRPEIEALALEVIDVTSGGEKAALEMKNDTAAFGTIAGEVKVVEQNIAKMSNTWQW